MAKQLRELKGVGEKTEKLFQKIGITTTDDLLHYYPRNYDAYEEPEEIGSLKENTVAAIRATITTGVYVNKIRNLQVISITVADTTGRLAVAWFNAPYLKNTLKKGSASFSAAKFPGKKAAWKWSIRKFSPRLLTRKFCTACSQSTALRQD